MQSVWRMVTITVAAVAIASCSGGGGDGGSCGGIVCPTPTTPDAISNLSVAPASASPTVGQTVQLAPSLTTASSAVSVSYAYTSSAPATASVSPAGLVTAIAPGSAVISVSASGSGTGTKAATLSANVSINVVAPPPVVVTLTPTALTLNVGEPGTFSVQITGGSPTPTLVACTSSQAAVATTSIIASACRVVAVSAGNVTITALTSGGQQASAQVAVTALPPALTGFTVSPTSLSMSVGQTVPLAPSAQPAAASVTPVYTYSTSDPAVITVSASGVVTAIGAGSAKVAVTATGSGTGYTTSVLTVSLSATVTATQPGVTAVTVLPTSLSLITAQTAQLSATVTQPIGAPSASTTYGSTAPSVATVSASGLVTAIAAGTAVITVTAASPTSASFAAASATVQVPVTVIALPPALTGPFTVVPSPLTIAVGQSTTPSRNPNPASAAVVVTYSYASSNSAAATVSATGLIAGVAPGSSTITIVASGSGTGFASNSLTATLAVSVSASTPALLGPITISPSSSSLTVGQTTQLVTNANPASAVVAVTYAYTSTAPNTASVSSTGVVTAIAPGPATIQVTATGSGLGYATNSLIATSEVVVKSAIVPCQIVNRTFPISNTASTLSLNDCIRASGARATYSRIASNVQRTVLWQVNATYNGAGVLVTADTSGSALSYTSAGGTAGGYFLVPAGTWLYGVTGANAVTGNFAMDASAVADDVDGCRGVAIIGAVTATQRLTANSCVDPVNGTRRYDDFTIFAPGRACTIEMRVSGTTGSMQDPFLNVYNAAGNTLVGSNNNIDPNNRNARVTFTNCVDPSGSVLRLRPTSFEAGDYGDYILIVTFTP